MFGGVISSLFQCTIDPLGGSTVISPNIAEKIKGNLTRHFHANLTVF